MEQKLYDELLKALKECNVLVMVSWTKVRQELREMHAAAQKFQWVGLAATAIITVVLILLPTDFLVKGTGFVAFFTAGLLVIRRTGQMTKRVATGLAESDAALVGYQPAAVLLFTFGGKLADFVFFAVYIRGYSSWYTTLIQRPYLAGAVAASLAGKMVAVVYIETGYIAVPDTFDATTANDYVVRAGRALEVSTPGINPVELTGLYLRGEH